MTRLVESDTPRFEVCHHHLKQPLQNAETRDITRDDTDTNLLGLIFSDVQGALWWNPEAFREFSTFDWSCFFVRRWVVPMETTFTTFVTIANLNSPFIPE